MVGTKIAWVANVKWNNIPSSGNIAFSIKYLPIMRTESLFVLWNLTESDAILSISVILIIFFFLNLIAFCYKYFKKDKEKQLLSAIHFNEISLFPTF